VFIRGEKHPWHTLPGMGVDGMQGNGQGSRDIADSDAIIFRVNRVFRG
jgi:hypothetical protein